MTPFFSVCIPTYNRSNLLVRTVKSVLNQSYENYEIVISDNCSTDDTEMIVKSNFADNPKICYYRNNQNIGMVPNWRNCLEKAKGDYYLMLSDDDYLIYNDYLLDSSEIIKENPSVTLILGNFILRFRRKDVSRTYRLDKITSGKCVYTNYFTAKKIPDIFFVIQKREIALKNNYYIDNVITHDIQSFLLSMLEGDVAFINRYTGIYDLTFGNSISETIPAKWKDYITFFNRIIDFGKKAHLPSRFVNMPLKRKLHVVLRRKMSKTDKEWVWNQIDSCFGSAYLFRYKILYFIFQKIYFFYKLVHK
jgi:glycosyltransferase involved in cell wall biosynthesis